MEETKGRKFFTKRMTVRFPKNEEKEYVIINFCEKMTNEETKEEKIFGTTKNGEEKIVVIPNDKSPQQVKENGLYLCEKIPENYYPVFKLEGLKVYAIRVVGKIEILGGAQTVFTRSSNPNFVPRPGMFDIANIVIVHDGRRRVLRMFSKDDEGLENFEKAMESRGWIIVKRKSNHLEIRVEKKKDMLSLKNAIAANFYSREEIKKSKKTGIRN